MTLRRGTPGAPNSPARRPLLAARIAAAGRRCREFAGTVLLAFPWVLGAEAAHAQAPRPSVTLDAAPIGWRRFAEDVEALVLAALAEPSPEAERIRTAAAAEPAETAGLRLRFWIDAAGRFTRIEAPAAPGLDEALRAVLAERHAPAPPAGMPWPMTLLLRLTPEQEAPVSAG